jgi:guanylate kinase
MSTLPEAYLSKGRIIVFSAPSGTGKSTIAHAILADTPQLRFSISATTRKIRPGEIDGREYFFLSEADFKEKIFSSSFIEYENFFGNYYGTLKDKTNEALAGGEHLLMDLDVKGALNVKKIYKSDALLIFIKPPSLSSLKERLIKRDSDNEAEIANRLKRAEYELSFAEKYDKIVVNDDIEVAISQIKSLIYSFLNLTT